VTVTRDDPYLDEPGLPTRRICVDDGRFVEQRSGRNG
jgi:hypothetical protein